MGYRALIISLAIFGYVHCQQRYNICVPQSQQALCNSLELDGSMVTCRQAPTRLDCALQLTKGTVDAAYFNEEELLMLAQRQPNEHRVVATVRDVSRQEPYAFEGVVVVPNTHSGGFEGLKGGKYCHPGLGATDIRWSPRVLKAMEALATRNEPCPSDVKDKTAEEVEVETLSKFFAEACRPGPWSWNNTLDNELKSRYPNLCAMCTLPGVCAGYSTAESINIAGVSNNNNHIQALDCLVRNGTVAFAAWTHVRQFFQLRNPQNVAGYSLLCEDGARAPLTEDLLAANLSPCSIVRQPWGAVVARTAVADALLASLRSWWPNGAAGNISWQSALFSVLAPNPSAIAFFQDPTVSPLNYTSSIRRIPDIDSVSNCLPAHRWCTVSAQEQDKCNWVRTASYSLGVQPVISCQQRETVFQCLADISSDRSDFFAVDTHYGYLARQHYRLSPVKLVQNNHADSSRVAVLIKDSASANISRFENLRDKVACFPEFGGIAYVAFLRIAQQRGVISETECDYAKAVGEFFSSACSPGALDAAHAISEGSSYDSTSLCNACRTTNASEFTCAWDSSNLYYGNRGALRCLSDPASDVAVLELQNLTAQFEALNLLPANYRVLCANNSLSTSTGVADIPENCLIAMVVDAEILVKRNSPVARSVDTLLDALGSLFGYNAGASQLINLHLFSPFDGVKDLLFKDSTIGLTQPVVDNSIPQAKNYIEMFSHLEDCTNGASDDAPGRATRFIFSITILFFTALFTRFVAY